jgi:hypothetical protein
MDEHVIVLRKNGRIATYRRRHRSPDVEQWMQSALAAQRQAKAADPDATCSLSMEPLSAVIDEIIDNNHVHDFKEDNEHIMVCTLCGVEGPA